MSFAVVATLLVPIVVMALLSQFRRAPEESNTGRHRTRNPASQVENTKFFGSQVGGQSVINYAYTDMPWKLLIWDIRTFLTFAWALPWILWPIWPSSGGDFDELSFTRANAFCIFVHAILIVLQLCFLLLLPLAVLLPVWIVVIGLGVFFSVNWVLCRLLNGNSLTYRSDPKYAPELDEHSHEKWIFLNGVAVGEAWMMSNINRLALTFKRPIQGIHNSTSGIIFDVIECLIQRNFSYATTDVREAYKTVKGHLYDPRFSKVVFILHSQGGIEGGLVLDWLLQELPQDLLAKLEVYTFGCAANHFNNPHRHDISQKAEQNNPNALTTRITTITQSSITESPVELRKSSHSFNYANGTAETNRPAGTPATPTAAQDRSESHATMNNVLASDRAIGHIEHYAHTTDFVALWGVLHFVTNQLASPSLPRFIGRVFSRTSSRGGHQFCQHYLNGMFPLERNAAGEFVGCADTNDFMESVVEEARAGSELDDVREGFEKSWALIEMAGRQVSSDRYEVEVHGSFHTRISGDGKVRVKDLSRLWLYRNGRSPAETPKGLVADGDGVVRAGTL